MAGRRERIAGRHTQMYWMKIQEEYIVTHFTVLAV